MDKLLDRIKAAVAERKMTIKELVDELGLAESGFYYSIKMRSLRVDTLLKISERLGKPINFFFGEKTPDDYHNEWIRFMAEVEKLERDVDRNADHGKGLVYLHYDHVRDAFDTHYEELKGEWNMVKRDIIAHKILESKFFKEQKSDEKGWVVDRNVRGEQPTKKKGKKPKRK